MKYAGMAFVVISTASVGLQMSVALRNRCKLLRQLLSAIQILRNEISVCGTSLPQAFALMAVASRGSVEQLFAAIAREMDNRRWLTPVSAMELALQNNRVMMQDDHLCCILRQFASGLGKYDKDSQLQTIDMAANELSALLRHTEEDHSAHGKSYKLLGVCAGLSLVILLA